MPQIDYAKLADQARREAAPKVDYAALAKQARGTTKADPPKPRTLLSRSTPEDFPVLNLAKGAWNAVKEIPAGVKQMVTDPVGTVQMMGEAQGNLGVQAKEAFDRGDYFRSAVKGAEYLIPVLGPMMSASGDKMEQGKIAEGIGELATNTALMAYGGRPRATTTITKPPRMAGPANAKEAAAVAFAKQEGIPLDAATATGSQMLRKVQKKVESTYGGSGTADELRTAQGEHLTRVGTEQAVKAAPNATNPVAAGEGVRAALTRVIQNAHTSANTAYTRFRQGTQGVTMDTTAAKQQLRPVYERLMRESEIAPPQGAKAKAIVALDRFMNSPDIAPIGDVDAALSDFKALARGAEMPELRNQGQGIAANAVTRLDGELRARAAQAGPDTLKALEEGRAATRQKYAVADVLDMLSAEPGQVFRQLTQNKDVGLERLKAVEKFAPKELPNVGRAFLEDAMQQATAEGGFMHADRLWANWQKLGGETKRKLYSKQQIRDLDHYFLIAKRIKENPNPSGTATIPKLNMAELLAYFPAKGLSKMLMTPNGVKWLTEARIVSKSQSPATRALAISNITKAAQSAGVPLDMIPALTGEPETPTPSGIRR